MTCLEKFTLSDTGTYYKMKTEILNLICNIRHRVVLV
jgi:hypothetical protein